MAPRNGHGHILTAHSFGLPSLTRMDTLESNLNHSRSAFGEGGSPGTAKPLIDPWLGIGTLATACYLGILGTASLVALLLQAPQPRFHFPRSPSSRPRQKGASFPGAVSRGIPRASCSDETTSTATPTLCSDSTWAGSGRTPE